MQSRAIRLTVCTLIWIAFAASAGFIFYTEQHLSARRSMLRALDARAREASDALADLRPGQEAYVAAGQDLAFWVPKVAALIDNATAAVENSRQSAASTAGVAALEDAAARVKQFSDVDQRVRDYLKSDQPLMASDVVFNEGNETAGGAIRQVQAASAAEHAAFDTYEARQHDLELYTLSGAGLLGAFGLLVLALSGSGRTAEEVASGIPEAPTPTLFPRQELPALKSAAELCTDFGRVRDLHDVSTLLGRAAAAMEASGLIVWIGDARGADLRPVLAHGYSAQSLAKMPIVQRSADNAAAAAYRTGALQLVLARPGAMNGAIVAPLLTPAGCIGALTAEIKGGGETSDTAQALAAILAAQVAGVLGPASTAQAPSAGQRAANS